MGTLTAEPWEHLLPSRGNRAYVKYRACVTHESRGMYTDQDWDTYCRDVGTLTAALNLNAVADAGYTNGYLVACFLHHPRPLG